MDTHFQRRPVPLTPGEPVLTANPTASDVFGVSKRDLPAGKKLAGGVAALKPRSKSQPRGRRVNSAARQRPRSVSRERAALPSSHGTAVTVIASVKPMKRIKRKNVALQVTDNTVTVPTSYADLKKFNFDAVVAPAWGTVALQDELFPLLLPVIADAFGGVNGYIMAFGQRGTGKTALMQGDLGGGGSPGVMPRTLVEVAGLATAMDCSVSWSLYEVSNSQVKDLLPASVLAAASTSSSHVVTRHVTDKACVNDVLLTNVSHALALLSVAFMRRSQARSSQEATARFRSSMNLDGTVDAVPSPNTIMAFSIEPKTGSRSAELAVVDLAGPVDPGSTGGSRRESIKANAYLQHLGRVVRCRAAGERYVPTKSNPLTRILHEACGGNSRTSVIVTMSPHAANTKATLHTLQFAQQAQAVPNRPVFKAWELSRRPSPWEQSLQEHAATTRKHLSATPDTHWRGYVRSDAAVVATLKSWQRLSPIIDLEAADDRTADSLFYTELRERVRRAAVETMRSPRHGLPTPKPGSGSGSDRPTPTDAMSSSASSQVTSSPYREPSPASGYMPRPVRMPTRKAPQTGWLETPPAVGEPPAPLQLRSAPPPRKPAPAGAVPSDMPVQEFAARLDSLMGKLMAMGHQLEEIASVSSGSEGSTPRSLESSPPLPDAESSSPHRPSPRQASPPKQVTLPPPPGASATVLPTGAGPLSGFVCACSTAVLDTTLGAASLTTTDILTSAGATVIPLSSLEGTTRFADPDVVCIASASCLPGGDTGVVAAMTAGASVVGWPWASSSLQAGVALPAASYRLFDTLPATLPAAVPPTLATVHEVDEDGSASDVLSPRSTASAGTVVARQPPTPKSAGGSPRLPASVAGTGEDGGEDTAAASRDRQELRDAKQRIRRLLAQWDMVEGTLVAVSQEQVRLESDLEASNTAQHQLRAELAEERRRTDRLEAEISRLRAFIANGGGR